MPHIIATGLLAELLHSLLLELPDGETGEDKLLVSLKKDEGKKEMGKGEGGERQGRGNRHLKGRGKRNWRGRTKGGQHMF